MLKGEIWWANLPKPKMSGPGFKRPVLIIQADSFNKSKINTIICAVITSNVSLAKAPGNIHLKKSESKLPKESVINVSQIITIDKSLLSKYVSTLNKEIIKKVEYGLKIILDII
jgi:mRNA interferase MazF